MEELENDISERLDDSKIIVEHPAVSDDLPVIKPKTPRKPRTASQIRKLNVNERRLKDL
jgi:hypothetical protein